MSATRNKPIILPLFFLFFFYGPAPLAPQTPETGLPAGNGFSNKELKTPEYLSFRKKILKEIEIPDGNAVFEAKKSFTEKSDHNGYIVLTFDACDKGYSKELADYLVSEKIPATLFLSGKWIDRNPEIVGELAKNPLFEIENHGLSHKVCALGDEKKYGLRNTRNAAEMVDEIELNNRKIQAVTGRKPVFYRPAGAYADDLCLRIASRLSMEVAGYDTLSGDSFSKTPAKAMSRNIIKDARHGMVVLMHLNHPERNEVEALKRAVPELKKKGFSFCNLEDFAVK